MTNADIQKSKSEEFYVIDNSHFVCHGKDICRGIDTFYMGGGVFLCTW